MKLEHCALSITVPEDIHHFYQDILGMEKVKDFTLNRSLANDIFGIDTDTPVFLLKNDQMFFEIFITDIIPKKSFNHVCLAFDDRKSIFKHAEQNGYPVICKKRGNSDLIFISDKSGNVFEIKEKEK